MYGLTASVPTWPKIRVWPSGADLTASSMATVPAPPGLFSTKTDWPKPLVSSAATERATISLVPPGAKGTKNRTGLVGQVLACALPQVAPKANAPAPCSQARRDSESKDGAVWGMGAAVDQRVVSVVRPGPCSKLVAAQAAVDRYDRAGDITGPG